MNKIKLSDEAVCTIKYALKERIDRCQEQVLRNERQVKAGHTNFAEAVAFWNDEKREAQKALDELTGKDPDKEKPSRELQLNKTARKNNL